MHLSFGDWYSNHNAPAFHTCERIPFLPKPGCYSSLCRSSILLVHLSTDGHGLLLPLGITNVSVAMSHTSVWDHRPASALTSVWYMLGSGTARSEGNSRFRNHGIFHNRCPIMHLDQQLPEACHFSTSFLTLGKLWFCLFDNSHLKVYQVTSHGASGLHFRYHWNVRIYFCVPCGHWPIFSGGIRTHILKTSFNHVVVGSKQLSL